MAKEKIEQLQKELKLTKETQAGFRFDTSKSTKNFELALEQSYGQSNIKKTILRTRRTSLMLPFRPMVPRQAMGPVKRTISKEKIFKPKHILKSKAKQSQLKQKVQKNAFAKFKQVISEKSSQFPH